MMMIHRAHVRTAAVIVILLVAPVWAPAAWAQAQPAAPAQAATPAAAQAPAGTKKIVFLAGPKDHGAVGRHEYEKDLRELAWSLENASNLEDITTEVLVGKAPRDLSVLEDASAIVIVGSGDWLRNETNVLFPQFQATDGRTYDEETTAYLRSLDELIKAKGIGIAIFHYTMWVENWVGRRYYLNWLGGLWIPYASHNPVDTWTMSPLGVQHQVLRGVKPWTFRDEVFSRYFLFDNPRRTELLQGAPSNANNGAPRPVSWVYERPDGGRSFVWGGSDFHDNMHNVAEYRRYLLNAITWIAKIEVPAEGVMSPPPPEF
jgi:type 1 glutamine amidotransferase